MYDYMLFFNEQENIPFGELHFMLLFIIWSYLKYIYVFIKDLFQVPFQLPVREENSIKMLYIFYRGNKRVFIFYLQAA